MLAPTRKSKQQTRTGRTTHLIILRQDVLLSPQAMSRGLGMSWVAVGLGLGLAACTDRTYITVTVNACDALRVPWLMVVFGRPTDQVEVTLGDIDAKKNIVWPTRF